MDPLINLLPAKGHRPIWLDELETRVRREQPWLQCQREQRWQRWRRRLIVAGCMAAYAALAMAAVAATISLLG